MNAQHHELVRRAEVSAVVMGNGDQFMLVDLDRDNAEAAKVEAAARGFFFCGTMAYHDGQCRAKCVPGEEFTMLCAAFDFAMLVAAKLKHPDVFDLERIYRLPDTRHMN